MTYALVRSGTVQRTAGNPPTVFTRPDESVVAGYHLRSDLWAADGWLPVVDIGPQPTATQTGTEVLTPTGAQVDRTFTNIVNVPAILNRQQIEQALTAALAEIDTDRATMQARVAAITALTTATIGNVGQAQTAIRTIGAILGDLMPVLNRSAQTQKKLIRLARGALDAAD